MASKSVCSRCLRLVIQSSRPPTIRNNTRRSVVTSASNQHARRRNIHRSTTQHAQSTVQQHQSTPDVPPFAPRGQHQPPHQSESFPSPVLQPNNLFHSFTNSPSPHIRSRAATIRNNAYCPHPSHQPTRAPQNPSDPEALKRSLQPPAHVHYECPDCGIPVSCSEDHFASDYESHLQICDTLRQINEDDHDLVSGRTFHEFEWPGSQIEEAQVNMMNWDTLMYSREFNAINDERAMRQATRLLTYPLTVGSVLHELSPYNLKERLTPEGLRSLSGEFFDCTDSHTEHLLTFSLHVALRYTLHPPRTGAGTTISGLRPNPPPLRLFILGARAESSLPREVWAQLSYLFPRAPIHLIFIGPESMANRDAEFPLPPRTPANPFGAVVEDRLGGGIKISTYVEYFHTLFDAQHFAPFDPYFDAFVLFHPGLGHPASSHEWSATLPQLLSTKIPVICTGYTEFDMRRDIEWVEREAKGEMDLLLHPGENRFRSLRWDLNDLDPGDISCGNWGVWGFRGKRYEADEYRGGNQ